MMSLKCHPGHPCLSLSYDIFLLTILDALVLQMPMSSLHESPMVSIAHNPSPLSTLHLCLLANEAENEADTVLHLPAPSWFQWRER